MYDFYKKFFYDMLKILAEIKKKKKSRLEGGATIEIEIEIEISARHFFQCLLVDIEVGVDVLNVVIIFERFQ